MAGILGWVGWTNRDVASIAFRKSLERLCHGPRFRNRAVQETDGVSIGLVLRREPPGETWASPDGRLLMAVYGRPLIHTSSWRPVGPEELANNYLRTGIQALCEPDGSFTLALVDRLEGKVFALNDRTSSVPVLYAAGTGGIAFGSEAKALLPLAEIRPALNQEAVVSFLNLGYPVGAQTMFEGVRQLEPGSILEISIDGSTVKTKRYRDLRFEPQKRLKRAEAVEALTEALQEAHDATLTDNPNDFKLLLTGGFDSRAVLGFLDAMGKHPSEVLTWGVSDSVPGSDPAIARIVAKSLRVSSRFLFYDSSSLPAQMARWTSISELSSDNQGNFAAGPDFFEGMGVDADVPILIGDQMLGFGGGVGSLAQAVENVTRVPWGGLCSGLARMMTPDQAHDGGATLKAGISDVIDGAGSDHPKDVQDYLFFHLYVVRWLHAAAYFREPMVSPRRPMLLEPVIEVGRKLPRRLRVDKAVLVQLMKERMPQLAQLPISSANSLVDWDFEVRTAGPVRDLYLELLDWEAVAATPMADLIDENAYRRVSESYFSELANPIRRRPSRLPSPMALRRKLGVIPVAGTAVRAAESLARHVLRRNRSGGSGSILRRMALVSLLQASIDEGKFACTTTDNSSTPQTQQRNSE